MDIVQYDTSFGAKMAWCFPRTMLFFKWYIRTLAILAIIAGLLGCSFAMTVGTGNRTAMTITSNTSIPETIREVGPVAGEISEGVVSGITRP